MKEKIIITMMVISLIAAVLAGYVFFTQNSVFGIAGTQWILVAILFGVYSNHVHHCPLLKGGSCCSKSEEK